MADDCLQQAALAGRHWERLCQDLAVVAVPVSQESLVLFGQRG